jgi:predicted amidophosphoribosyltransferase
MSVNDQCFVSQQADKQILLHVTNVCAECYRDLHPGDAIYYDMLSYRYLCAACAEELSERMNEACEIEEESSASLF